MLFRADVTDYTGTVFKTTGMHVLNTDRIARHYDKDGVYSNVLYSENPKDRRSNPMHCILNMIDSDIQGWMDTVPSSNIIMLSIFPDNDITQTPVDKYLKLSDFVHAHAWQKNSDYSVVTMVEGFHIRKRWVVSQSMDQILSSVVTWVGPLEIDMAYPGLNDLAVYLNGSGLGRIVSPADSSEEVVEFSDNGGNRGARYTASVQDSGTILIYWTDAIYSVYANVSVTDIRIPASATSIRNIQSTSSDNLTSITTHKEWVNLETLNFQYSGLLSIQTHKEWVKLKEVSIWYAANEPDDHLSSFVTHAEWVNLEILNLSANHTISSINTYASWVNLRYLGVSYNNLTAITTHKEWVNLTDFYVHVNNISSVETHAEWTKLQNFYVSENSSLSTIVTHSEWVDLIRLIFDNTSISSINTYNTWVDLQYINGYSTNLSSLTTYAEWTLFRSILTNDTSLTSLVIHSEWTNFSQLQAKNCAISSASDINNILSVWDTINYQSFFFLWLDGGTNASPTDPGLTSLFNIRTKGISSSLQVNTSYIISAEVGNVQDNYVTLFTNESITQGTGNESEFTVTINGSPAGITGSIIGANPMTLILDTSVQVGDVVLVSYSGGSWGTASKNLEYASGFPVTNNVT